MNTYNKTFSIGMVFLAALTLLALVAGFTYAQGQGPESSAQPQGEAGVATIAPGAIPIQGRLTNRSGVPLSGTYTVTFRLYDDASAVTALCSDIRPVAVQSGLFSDYMDHCYDDINGQKLWLGVQVESDPEMAPRQVIYPVPYALSLVPGAVISYSSSSSILTVRNSGGEGIHGIGSPGVLGENGGFGNGIVGRAGLLGAGVKGEGNALAFGGLFTNTLGGTALRAESDGIALQLGGSGSIESTADIAVAVSPLKMIPQRESIGDLEFLSDGVYMEVRPSTSGFQYVHIPVDLPSTLFGTTTKLKSARICYRCDQAGSFVSTTIVDQGTDSGTINQLINDVTSRTSTSWDCYTVTDSTPNAIQGSLYIQLTLSFAGTGSTHDIRIGNITLVLTEQ
jgi:hypothetical protein